MSRAERAHHGRGKEPVSNRFARRRGCNVAVDRRVLSCRTYVPQIQFLEPKVARAANFLNQEVTFVFGTVLDNGARPIRQIEVTLEFHDPFNQVVLRDKQRLFSATAIPLAPHDRRDFQLGYETLPVQWNQAYPTITITGLQLY